VTARTALVTGAAGQVGHALVWVLGDGRWRVVACDRARLDITDPVAVAGALDAERPDVVVNAAAYNAVDAAEADPDAACAVNDAAVGHLVEACERVGARLCHLSTDYVFDGTSDRPYIETDPTNPMSVYGRSKEAGERRLRPDDLLVRTSWVCGEHGRNFVKTVLALAADPDRDLAFVDDQRGCPTMAADLAGMILRLVEEGHTGTFHVTNGGPTTWWGLAREVLELAGHDPERARPIATSQLDPPRPAPRPRNSVLDGAALRSCGLPPLRHHADALGELVGRLGR